MPRKRHRNRPTPPRGWQPLQRAVLSDPDRYARLGLDPPDAVYGNDRYTVAVRDLGDGGLGGSSALHLSFHRHDREAVRDWRHFQAIKNEVAGPERTAIEIFPPESQLVDAANEYHLWVLPENFPLPFVIPVRNVKTDAESRAEFGPSKARQRDWERGIPTGKGLEVRP